MVEANQTVNEMSSSCRPITKHTALISEEQRDEEGTRKKPEDADLERRLRTKQLSDARMRKESLCYYVSICWNGAESMGGVLLGACTVNADLIAAEPNVA